MRSDARVCGGLLASSFVLFALLALTWAQDMQFDCILCADRFDKCELDCSWNNMAANATFIAECHADCRETLNVRYIYLTYKTCIAIHY